MKINRHSNNFDFLRLLFASIVAIVHIGELSKIDAISNITQLLSAELAVDSFFVISGFLIFMSYESSTSISSYASKRIRRIFPGYTMVILLCAFLLFFVSTKGFSEYFNTDFLKYILFNLLTLNFIHPELPGVFEHNSWQAINGALWTIKIEVMFYMTVPIIAFLLSKMKKILVLSLIYILSLLYSIIMIWLYSKYNLEIFLKLERQLPGQLVFFISGATIYYYYDVFVKHSFIFFISAVVILLLNKFTLELYFLYPVSLSVVVLYFANIFKYIGNFGKFGDLSFGVYIWHFPIIQLFVFYGLFSTPILGISILIATIFFISFISWHLVEKQFLFKSSHYILTEKSHHN